MNLPNLFLADLGPGLQLSAPTVREACAALRRNREHWLARQRTRQLIDVLAYTADQWRQPDNYFRLRVLTDGPRETGWSRATLERGLDGWLKGMTYEGLEALVQQDVGDLRRLDEFTSGMAEQRTGRMTVARGPRLLAHVSAGNLPVSALTSMVLGVLTKSAQFLKCAQGTSWVPRLFAHSLAFNEPKLGACFELAEWPGGTRDLEEALFAEADVVTATGADATLAEVRSRVPAGTRLVCYGHRVSFAYVSKDMLSSYSIKRVVRDVAADVTAWDQMGCLSPHVVYVQEDGVLSPEGFAEALAEELARRETLEPRGEIRPEEAGAIQARRTVYALRAAAPAVGTDNLRHDSQFSDPPYGIRLWQSEGSTAWTVVWEADPRFETSCLNRFIYVKSVRRLDDVLQFAEPIRQHVSTVGLAAVDHHLSELAAKLAQWGVPRVCPVGRMQEPPVAWRHDGRPALGDLVTFTDWET
jgi:hypothetical protein